MWTEQGSGPRAKKQEIPGTDRFHEGRLIATNNLIWKNRGEEFLRIIKSVAAVGSKGVRNLQRPARFKKARGPERI